MPGTPARGRLSLIVASREVLRGNVDEGIRLAEQAATEASELEGPEIANATRGDVAMLLLSAGRREESRALMTDVIAEARTNHFSMSEHIGRPARLHRRARGRLRVRTPCSRVRRWSNSKRRQPWETWALQWLGYAYLGLGDRGSARATFGELLEISADAGKTVRPELAVALGGLARSVEQWTSAKAPGWRERSHNCANEAGGLKTWMWPQEREIEVRFEQPLIDALGEGEYRSAHEEGRALSFEETLELARSLAAS